MELNLKYNARIIDEIEQSKKKPIESCIADVSVDMIATFVQKGLIDENGVHGVSRNVAISTIDEYLETKDKDDLLLDIMEALVKAGFLSKDVNVDNIRTLKKQRAIELNQQIQQL